MRMTLPSWAIVGVDSSCTVPHAGLSDKTLSTFLSSVSATLPQFALQELLPQLAEERSLERLCQAVESLEMDLDGDPSTIKGELQMRLRETQEKKSLSIVESFYPLRREYMLCVPFQMQHPRDLQHSAQTEELLADDNRHRPSHPSQDRHSFWCDRWSLQGRKTPANHAVIHVYM